MNSGAITLTLTNISGLTIGVYATTDIISPNSWTFLGYMTESPAGSGQYQFNDSQQAKFRQRFYQVHVGP